MAAHVRPNPAGRRPTPRLHHRSGTDAPAWQHHSFPARLPPRREFHPERIPPALVANGEHALGVVVVPGDGVPVVALEVVAKGGVLADQHLGKPLGYLVHVAYP